jgi:hypothetical protein
MNPNKYKSVSMKIDTYDKLKYISKNRFDVEVSLASMAENLVNEMYAKITDPHYVKPLKGNSQYQVYKKKLLNSLRWGV